MYDIKRLEAGQKQQQQQQHINNNYTFTTTAIPTTSTQHERLGTNTAKQQQQQQKPFQLTCSVITSTPTSTSTSTSTKVNNSSASCNSKASSITRSGSISISSSSSNSSYDPAEATHMTLLTLRRRRMFQRRACLLSILAAFVFGLALGVFVPMFGLPEYLSNGFPTLPVALETNEISATQLNLSEQQATHVRPPSNFPTIYETSEDAAANANNNEQYTVAFIKESLELSAEQVFRNAFHLEQDKNAPDSMIVKKLDTNDGSIKEFHVQRTSNGRYLKGPERRLSKPTLVEQLLVPPDAAAAAADDQATATSINFVPIAQRIVSESARSQRNQGIIKADIYWGDLVERALPHGFGKTEMHQWDSYVARKGIVTRLEAGCGRMQNRLVIFADGTRACARYRQNTDQIQGELFSFFLGQLLNISNLAPSAATVIDTTSNTWSAALGDITQAQWKEQRPVVLTRWLPDLEAAGIPQPFQPLERHLNKFDVWNITLSAATEAMRQQQQQQQQKRHEHEQQHGDDDDDDAENNNNNDNDKVGDTNQRGLLKRLEAASSQTHAHQSRMLDSSSSSSSTITTTASSNYADAVVVAATTTTSTTTPVLQRLIELAQWSDLIVFDYLIANLDRVVNNLYNFQWNADIMAAPAHNLARQINSQLLVFLDNESGLLHGYRLLKKYEAYHSLLLDNLCVFRKPTIEALQRLRNDGAGRRLRELFEQTTSSNVRDVLPSLPDKSIKILVDRIDRVLGQVQKCRDLLSDR